MRVLITGAHFTPAVATIEQLKKYKGTEIIYVGRKTTLEGDKSPSQESQILPKLGTKFIPITAGRLQRSFTIYTIPSLLKIPIGFLQSLHIIFSQKPDVILSFGGYVAVPVVFAGWLFSIPIMVHEQTLVSGLANRISAFFADKIALSFKGNQSYDKPMIITGNPIRRDVLEGAKLDHLEGELDWHTRIFNVARKEKLPVVLITGGNQGSHTINMAVKSCLAKLINIACIIHVTGDNKFNDFEKLKGLGEFEGRYVVMKWIGQEWGRILHKIDLAISRAGINTLTELAWIGKPALVIPLPYLYQDEQNQNAHLFQNLGLVKTLSQSKLSSRVLLENITDMLKNLEQWKKSAITARKIVIPDAAKRLALETVLLYETTKV